MESLALMQFWRKSFWSFISNRFLKSSQCFNSFYVITIEMRPVSETTHQSHRWRWYKAGFWQPMRRQQRSASVIHHTTCLWEWRPEGWWTCSLRLWPLLWQSWSSHIPEDQTIKHLQEYFSLKSLLFRENISNISGNCVEPYFFFNKCSCIHIQMESLAKLNQFVPTGIYLKSYMM